MTFFVEIPDGDGKGEDPVMLKLALRVCREDLTKALLELNKYCDVMHDWEALDHVHKQTLQQVGNTHRCKCVCTHTHTLWI